MSWELDDAAARALWPLRSATTESLGVLYRLPDGSIAFTDPVVGGKNRAKGSFSIPAGSLLGIFHNHPLSGREAKDRNLRRFSPADVKQAQRLGVPSYIIAGDQLFRYDPRPIAPDAFSNVRGEPVLAMIPIEDILRLHAARNPLMAAYLAQRDQDQKVAANGNSNAR